mgnify:CR=1 FL=1
MSTVKITTTNFEQEVLQSQIPVLLDFWADSLSHGSSDH